MGCASSKKKQDDVVLTNLARRSAGANKEPWFDAAQTADIKVEMADAPAAAEPDAEAPAPAPAPAPAENSVDEAAAPVRGPEIPELNVGAEPLAEDSELVLSEDSVSRRSELASPSIGVSVHPAPADWALKPTFQLARSPTRPTRAAAPAAQAATAAPLRAPSDSSIPVEVVADATFETLCELVAATGGRFTPETIPTRLLGKIYADVTRVRDELENRRPERYGSNSVAGKRMAIEHWFDEQRERRRGVR